MAKRRGWGWEGLGGWQRHGRVVGRDEIADSPIAMIATAFPGRFLVRGSGEALQVRQEICEQPLEAAGKGSRHNSSSLWCGWRSGVDLDPDRNGSGSFFFLHARRDHGRGCGARERHGNCRGRT